MKEILTKSLCLAGPAGGTPCEWLRCQSMEAQGDAVSHQDCLWGSGLCPNHRTIPAGKALQDPLIQWNPNPRVCSQSPGAVGAGTALEAKAEFPGSRQWLPAPIPPYPFFSNQVFSPCPCERFLLDVHVEIIQEFRIFIYLSPGVFSQNALEAFSLLQFQLLLWRGCPWEIGCFWRSGKKSGEIFLLSLGHSQFFFEFSTGPAAGAGNWDFFSYI